MSLSLRLLFPRVAFLQPPQAFSAANQLEPTCLVSEKFVRIKSRMSFVHHLLVERDLVEG
jgi:hypothetical protein